jgi:hypothetical protein
MNKYAKYANKWKCLNTIELEALADGLSNYDSGTYTHEFKMELRNQLHKELEQRELTKTLLKAKLYEPTDAILVAPLYWDLD